MPGEPIRPDRGRLIAPPGPVRSAVVMTYFGASIQGVFAVLTAVGAGASLPVAADRDAAGLWFLLAVGLVPLVFSAVIVMSAARAWRGKNAGRIVLTVVGALAVVVLVAALYLWGHTALPLVGMPAVWTTTAIGLLYTPSANRWFFVHRV